MLHWTSKPRLQCAHTAKRFLLPMLCLLSVAHARAAETPWRDPSPHSVQFIHVEQDVRLEVLDWGGSGRAVVLLAGLGNTGHVFDRFAPKLLAKFHVYGITRRGFGDSSAPPAGYDASRLNRDIVAVINELKLSRPLLIGHSFAGDELSGIGADFPNLISGLIYLDAAADRTGPTPQEYTTLYRSLPPAASTQAQVDAYASFAAMASYASQPESETRAKYRVNDTGKLVARVEPRVLQAIVAGMRKPEYEKIVVPALAFFAVPASAAEFLPWVKTDDPAIRANMDRIHELNVANIRRQLAAFDAGVANSAAIELLGAKHQVFVSNESDVLDAIHVFADKELRP
jgi:non-heme chloroperoxidase